MEKKNIFLATILDAVLDFSARHRLCQFMPAVSETIERAKKLGEGVAGSGLPLEIVAFLAHSHPTNQNNIFLNIFLQTSDGLAERIPSATPHKSNKSNLSMTNITSAEVACQNIQVLFSDPSTVHTLQAAFLFITLKIHADVIENTLNYCPVPNYCSCQDTEYILLFLAHLSRR